MANDIVIVKEENTIVVKSVGIQPVVDYSNYFNKILDDSDDINEGVANLFLTLLERGVISGVDDSYEVVGVRGDGTLVVRIGDFDESGNGMMVEISDQGKAIRIGDVNESFNGNIIEVDDANNKVGVYSPIGKLDAQVKQFDLNINGEPNPEVRQVLAVKSLDGATATMTFQSLNDRLIYFPTAFLTYEIDWSLSETWEIVMIGNVTFSEINLPTGNFTKVITIYLSGNHVPTFPASWGVYVSGTYDGTVMNQICVEYVSSRITWVTINQI